MIMIDKNFLKKNSNAKIELFRFIKWICLKFTKLLFAFVTFS